MNRLIKKTMVLVFTMTMVLFVAGCSGGSSNDKLLDSKNPTTVTVWNYYNGDQLAAFEELVAEFNHTVGIEKGIIVDSVSQGSIDNLAESLINSAEGKVGAEDLPALAAIYSETAYILDKTKDIVPLNQYFSEEELNEYIPGFIDEGKFREGGELMIFPVSKSTEAFVTNLTDWEPFAKATGITPESITDVEKLTLAAKAYYEYTDALTPDILEDGSALYGRDSISNYIYISAKQLGHELFVVNEDGTVTVDLDKETFRKIWDNYYIPYINGYFAAYASHRSEDMKTGSVLCMTGSSSGVSYIPSEVIHIDDSRHEVDISIRKSLCFSNPGEEVYVQQGAGYCILKTDEAKQYASAVFLKWFTESERNIEFSIMSGYSPVKLEANDKDLIESTYKELNEKNSKQIVLDSLLESSDVYMNNQTYVCKSFDGSKEIRDLLQSELVNICAADRSVVERKIKNGLSRQEAVASFVTDEYFDTWYSEICEKVNKVIQ